MSKLSDLIKFRNELVKFVSKLDTDSTMNQQIAESVALVEHNPVSTADQINGVAARYKEYSDQYQGIISAYKKIIINTETAIDRAGTEIIKSSDLMSKDELGVLSTALPLNSGIPNKILSQLYQHSNTLYPGLIFTPCLEEYVRYMAASDPLYLLGRNLDYLKTLVKNLPDQYQNRLGLYDDIEKLPMNQFSIIIASDFFHQIHYSQVVEYLQTAFRLLRPGGCVIFTFNNADIYEIAVQAELKLISFSSQAKLAKDSVRLGFEILEFNNDFIDIANYKYTSWAMLKKPGTLATIKRSQSQGLIGRK